MNNEEKTIKADRMRYNKNKFSSNFALVAILFDILFFVNIYRSNVGSYYYTAMIGISIIYNLLFLLVAFLCSEELKAYSMKYAYVIGVVGILQFARIFVIPMKAHSSYITVQKVDTVVMENAQFIKCIFYLGISGICCIVSSVAGVIRSGKLKAHLESLDEEKRRD